MGVLPPLGVFDPLGLAEQKDMIRYNNIEIKHGRIAMVPGEEGGQNRVITQKTQALYIRAF